MLDQNTDRMWFVIGALVIGAGIILLANKTMPELFAKVGRTFDEMTDEGVDGASELAVYTAEEEASAKNTLKAFGREWLFRSITNQNVATVNNGIVTVPSGVDLFSKTAAPKNEPAKVKFTAKGNGKVQIRFGSNLSEEASAYVELTNQWTDYEVEITRVHHYNTNILFLVPVGGHMELSNAEFIY